MFAICVTLLPFSHIKNFLLIKLTAIISYYLHAYLGEALVLTPLIGTLVDLRFTPLFHPLMGAASVTFYCLQVRHAKISQQLAGGTR